MVIENRIKSPVRKIISAIFSKRIPLASVLRIDRKEKMQLAIKNTIATAVSSSIKEPSLNSLTLSDVNTIKQKPSNVAEVFSICGEVLFL